MNRAERRMMEKIHRSPPKPGRQINKDVAAKQIYTTLYCASVEPLSDEKRDAIIVPYYARIEQLRTGHLDENGYVEINEGLAAAYSLAVLIYERGTRAAKDAVMPSADVFKTAAEALNNLGHRFIEKGKYIARGEELEHIRAGAQWLDEMLKISDEGIALKALRQAAQLVSQKLKEQMK